MAQPATSAGSVSKELHSSVSVVQCLNPAVRSTTATGGTVDLQGYESAEMIIAAGAWTDGVHTMSAEESDDDSTFTAVVAGDLIGAMPVIDGAADDDQAYRVGYRGEKRYIRPKVTVTGSPATGVLIGVVVVRGHPRHAPVA